jgi:hypothetical protein
VWLLKSLNGFCVCRGCVPCSWLLCGLVAGVAQAWQRRGTVLLSALHLLDTLCHSMKFCVGACVVGACSNIGRRVMAPCWPLVKDDGPSCIVDAAVGWPQPPTTSPTLSAVELLTRGLTWADAGVTKQFGPLNQCFASFLQDVELSFLAAHCMPCSVWQLVPCRG